MAEKKTYKIELTKTEIKQLLNALRGWCSQLYDVYKIGKKKANNPYRKAYGDLKKLENFFSDVIR